MGKYGTNNTKTDTKVLFKKSNITIRTHSRTCSDASQMARSGILQIKKTLSRSNDYYKEGDKVKRDLSVETGFCILRRYYKSKHKRDKCSVQASTAKSKCTSVADTEIDSDFKPDASACGDSRNKFEIVSQINPPNIDITAMMVENLKSLLNEWIRKHVLEDAETKKKLINVLDSILHSLESKISSSRSSCSTYIVERNGEGYKVRNKKTATNSITCQYCKHKQTSIITSRSSSVLFRKYSRLTTPFPYRHVRIISTLSIPRNLYRKDRIKKKDMVNKVKKVSKKNIVVSSNKKERKVVINVSSCETSASKKSMKKCSKPHEKKSQIKKRGVVFLPHMVYKSTTEYTSTTEVEEAHNTSVEKKQIHLDTMPSLVKSIYADDPANVTSTDNITTHNNRNDNFTMTQASYPSVKVGNSISNVQFHQAKYECCKKNIKAPRMINKRLISHSNFDYINHGLEFPNIKVSELEATKHSKKITTVKSRLRKKSAKAPLKRKSVLRKMTPLLKYENIKYKHFTYLYKKTNSKVIQENELLNHFRNVFKYFANYEGERNIKLEINCNVYPFFDTKEKKSNIDNKELRNCELHMNPETDCKIETAKVVSAVEHVDSAAEHVNSVVEHVDKSEHSSKESELIPGIIPLLDGAVSQAKYIFKSDNSTSKSEDTMKYSDSIDQGTVMTVLEVSKELNELKIAIKDLSATAERIVQDHLKIKLDEESSNSHPSNVPKTKNQQASTNEKLLKRSAISKGIQFSNTIAKGQLLSGIKLSKEPKRVEEFTNNLKKRSSSYHVIDSESILKVTDMTSNVMPSSKLENQTKLKKSQSLLHLTTEANKQRLLAFFCDDCRRHDKIIYSITSRSSKSRRAPSPKDSPCTFQYCKQRSNDSLENKIYIPVKLSQESYKGCNHEYCSSVYVDIDKPTITVKKRGGLPFWEGCLYCILLWIPLIVIIYLFYDFVLKDLINKPSDTTTTTTTKPKAFFMESKATPLASNDSKPSRFLLKLSDFGF